ncbi:MAG TPA: MFS transporter [Chloroflexi bacterium]|nr:MFS transporter [Chloroflexota bacterium]
MSSENGPQGRGPDPSRRPVLQRVAGLAAVDLGPLRRHRDFRLLFGGRSVSEFGSEITVVAIPFQVYALTRSSLAVGLLGLFAIVPIITLAFVGGALADARDRRRMVLLTELALTGFALALLANALVPHSQLWVLYAAETGMTGLAALQRPSLAALVPRLVDRDELTAAAALNGLYGTAGTVAGPALAGILIATLGLPSTYGIDVLTFLVSLAALRSMRAVPPPTDAARISLESITEAVRYAWSRPDLMGTYLVDMVAMFFGMPTALFPALAARYGGAGVLGLLYTAPSVGALLATASSGWTSRVHRHGIAVILAAASWGAAILIFGLAPVLPLALTFLAVAGAADEISAIFRSTIWNQTIPDVLRGRLAGIELLSYSSGPTLGNIEAGAVASKFSVEASIVSGGILCMVGVAALAVALPTFRRYDRRVHDAEMAASALTP